MSEDKNKEKILAKIKKLMSRAKSGDSGECAIAMRAAQNMMREHGITEDTLELADCETVSNRWFDAEKPQNYEMWLLEIVTEAFGVKSTLQTTFNFKKYKRQMRPVFYGVAPNADLADYCFDVLYRAMKKARREFASSLRKGLKRKTIIKRADSFCTGWVHEIQDLVERFAPSERNAKLVEKYYKQKTQNTQFESFSADDRLKGSIDGKSAGAGASAAKGVSLSAAVHGKETLKLTSEV